MKRMLALVVACLFVSASAALTALAADEKNPTTKVIMKKLHGGKASVSAKLKTQLKSEEPNWEVVAKESEEYFVLSAALGKNEPTKGDKASWDKLSGEYHEGAKELRTAAEDKNKETVKAAFKKLGTTCKACHDVHKGK